ncbi:MAG: hypothetical protein F6K14_25985 [Symploca sp. SIO2C1]|nr:hypothetical protein [Symploca sp. SIO2C1]
MFLTFIAGGTPPVRRYLYIPLLSLSEILTKFRNYSQRHLTRESGFDPHFSESDRRGIYIVKIGLNTFCEYTEPETDSLLPASKDKERE